MNNLERTIAVSCMSNLPLEIQMDLVSSPVEISDILALKASEIHEITGKVVNCNWYGRNSRRYYEAFLRWVEKPGNKVTTVFDNSYPSLLQEINDPPLLLTYRGTLEQSGRFLSVVGTRTASERAVQAAFTLGLECAASGITVVSGFARGIDQAVHQGALALPASTWAVMGSGLVGLDKLPVRLVRGFLDRGGTFFSEFHPEATPLSWRFPIRNRIIAGLSPATVVVQAPGRSGSLITADHALRQGRDVLVHRIGLDNAAGAGGRALVESGAPVVHWLGEIVDACGFDFEIPYRAIVSTAETGELRYRFGSNHYMLSTQVRL